MKLGQRQSLGSFDQRAIKTPVLSRNSTSMPTGINTITDVESSIPTIGDSQSKPKFDGINRGN